MSLLNDIIKELSFDGYPDVEGAENSSEYILNVDLETEYANDFIDDLENVLLYLGYSPIEDFDGIEVNKIGKSRYDGDLDYLANFEVILYKDNY
jgi:hypothetical protein|tara:strand:+ start:982 stop:1263 length:282 start_codon:yes stop_codon:yes gene_type:complete